MASRYDFENKHVLVTGGGTGIGAAISEAFAVEGAKVTIIGRRAEVLESQVAALGKLGARANWIACDITDIVAVKSVMLNAAERLGRIDVLVNNAGKAQSAPFLRTSPEMVKQALDVNVVQLFTCTQQVLPAMIEARFGRVINIASTASLNGYPYVTAYCASKHAVLGFTRALAMEVVHTGVTVNAVCPSYTETPLLQTAIDAMMQHTGRTAAEIRAELVKGNPAGKLVQPSEVASVVTWLARSTSAAITGQAIPVAYGEVMSR